MPWLPELFSAPAVARIEEESRREGLDTVPYFLGFLSGETDALIGSFVGEPEVHYPLRGRVKGERAFRAYAAATKSWLEERGASIEEVGEVTTRRRRVGEAVLHFGEDGVDLPVAIVADRQPDLRIEEVRVYYSNWALSGRHANRPPLLQADPELREPDVVAEYQRALGAGDVEAVVDKFEADGYAREPAESGYVHHGPEGLKAFYTWLFSNGGGISLESCACTDDGRTCALEYNVVRWGRAELTPQAGIAVCSRGEGGGLAAVRIYDDVEPPLEKPGW